MGKRRGGELGVNKKGTPLYSREDIREQYCINDKELQVLDRQGSKGLFGCFSNQGQPGFSPCSGGSKNRKSILGSCIARTSSEEELQNQIQITAKRPISPGLRSTTWNGQQRYFDPRQDEDDGFDEQYFRRRPKSFCMPPGGSVGPQGRYLPQGAPGLSVLPPMGPQPIGLPPPGIYGDGRVVETDQQRMMAFNSHSMLRSTPYPVSGMIPGGPGVSSALDPCPPFGGGYTLPPTAAFFPMGSYSTNMQPTTSTSHQTTMVEMQHDPTGLTQPNTPDLLMHRRQGGTPEVSLDDRKQKHVSFDSSSLMRSQTMATVDEATFQRIQATQPVHASQSVSPALPGHTTPSKSYERLIDGKMTPDYEYFQQVLPPELARQIMLERLKRNSMRTQATQTDTSRNRHSSHIPISPRTAQKVFMVSEGVQTNGFNNGSGIPMPPHPGFSFQPLSKSAKTTSPIKMEFTSPVQLRSGSSTSTHMTTFKLQTNHFDSRDVSGAPEWHVVQENPNTSANYATAPRPPRECSHTSDEHHFSNLHHQQRPKISARSMSQGDMLGPNELKEASLAIHKGPHLQQPQQRKQVHHHHQKSQESLQRRKNQGSMSIQHGHHHHHHHHHRPHTHRLHKSHSDGELLDDEDVSGGRSRSRFKSTKPVKLVSTKDHSSQITAPDFRKEAPTWDDDASYRDLPELAPIKQNVRKNGEADDLEIDLGQKLSPLGSNSSLQDLIEDKPPTEALSPGLNITWSDLERRKLECQPDPEQCIQTLRDDPGLVQHLSAGEDNGEDEEEHVASYLEQRPLKITKVGEVEKSPESHKSSSSGSYSVVSGLCQKNTQSPSDNLEDLNRRKEGQATVADSNSLLDEPQTENVFSNDFQSEVEDSENKSNPCIEEESKDDSNELQEGSSEPEAKPTPAMLRKQELTLNLQKEASSLPLSKSQEEFTSPDESASENSLMWQRLPLGTGDVQKKRAAFESQIRCLAEDAKPKVLNGKVRTPGSGAVRKIVSEERAAMSPLGASGLARSPAMHSGFRTEDWVVERTPVNTPVNDRVLVGMIHLSDEENSCHASSEELCKSSGATTPLGSINSSCEPSPVGATKEDPERSYPSPAVINQVVVMTTPSQVEELSRKDVAQDEMKKQFVATESETSSAATVKKESVQEPLMAPPAGFGDSPEHLPKKKLAGLREAIHDELLPQDELLTAEVFSPLNMPTMQIAEAFQTQFCEVAEAIQHQVIVQNTIQTESIVDEVDLSQSQPPHHKLERLSERKSSSASLTSKASGASRSRSRSRSKERLLSKLAHSGEIVITSEEDDDIKGFYIGAYDKKTWAFIGKLSASSRSVAGIAPGPLIRSDSIESTQSEREFRKKYQAITHRMVHRKSSAVMYNRILERTFECNKTVRVRRVKGEFGFRIHGSRPVVISAIEPNTPAETSKLEVGDIILTINGINVLDLPHTEVVKTAQTGNDELELGLARVPDLSCPEDPIDVALGRLDDSLAIIYTGYLWKLSRSVFPGGEAKWSKRFFILRADSCLYFFKHESECRPLGAILVSGCSVIEGCEVEDQQAGLGRNFAFRLVFPSQSQPSSLHQNPLEVETFSQPYRVLCLAADSKDELSPWLNTINQCAQNQDNTEDPWRVLAEERHHLEASQFLRPDCKGYLLKLDAKTRTWKRRFCVLADSCLFLYSDSESRSAIASLCLQGYRAQSTGSIGSKRHVFELMPPDQGMRFFYFMAETETEKKRWLASLEYSMDRWLKLS